MYVVYLNTAILSLKGLLQGYTAVEKDPLKFPFFLKMTQNSPTWGPRAPSPKVQLGPCKSDS